MRNLRKGDIVVRKSYGKDILFSVEKIINTTEGKRVIISGVNERIEADSNLSDLEIVDKKTVKKILKEMDKRIDNANKLKKDNYKIGIVTTKGSRLKQKIVTGRILHLDGEANYMNI